MTQTRKARIGLCSYCGQLGPITYDHVPAACIYSKPRPSNLITVPSCDPCNGGKKKDEEYFRAVIVSVTSHPTALALNERITSKFNKGEGLGFQETLLSQLDSVEVFTRSGT